jgi:hypothetical protein
MKTLVTMLTAAAFAAGLAGHAHAGPHKKKRLYYPHYSKYHGGYGKYYGGYTEQRLEAHRLGSREWWDIYLRQRGPRG